MAWDSEYCKKWKEKNPEYWKEWNKRNPELSKAYQKAYRDRFPERLKATQKTYRERNKERTAARDRARKEKSPEKVRAAKEAWRKANLSRVAEKMMEWRKRNADRNKVLKRESWERVGRQTQRQARRDRMNTDYLFKVTDNLRKRLRRLIRMARLKKTRTIGSIDNLTGCTGDFLLKYLETQFLPGMSWENYGRRGWHVDHIRPCLSFDFTDGNQQKQCFHFTNLQPLWATDNLAKGSKWEATV